MVAVLLWGCSATKHVPDGQLLLDQVRINIDSDTIDVAELYNFLRQTPNHKVLGFAKLQLATYNIAGLDTTKWYNRWLKSAGQAPVIYNSDLTEKSRRQLTQALINRGYMDVSVQVDTVVRRDDKRINVNYNIITGQPHVIADISYDIPQPEITEILTADSLLTKIKPGQLFDRNRLDIFRTDVTMALRNHGYYTFNNDYISFIADTVAGSKDIGLTMVIRPTLSTSSAQTDSVEYSQYRIRHVYFVTDFDPQTYDGTLNLSHCDSVDYKGITVLYGHDHYIRPSILEEKCYIVPGGLYSASAIERTYEALGQLSIIKSVNITMQPVGNVLGTQWLDAYVLLSRNKKQSVSVELEGTNSEGDLGVGVGATYQHRNLAKGSELLGVKLRASYESLSGNFTNLVNNRYTEYAGEVSITFPKFKFPLLSSRIKKRMRASTEFAASINYQERPEYTRVIAGVGWKYKWTRNRGDYRYRHTYDLIDASYIKLPKSTINFLDSIAPANPLLRYSYEDHSIMRTGYTFTATNRRIPTATANAFVIQPSVTSFRGSFEMAGNLLYAISNIIGQHKRNGAYHILGVQYAQYVKAEADYNYTQNLNSRNALAFHIGGGVAVPYGNSSMVPFEKRFYAGGANNVRGWGVRTLGPGCYDAHNSVTNFINQCGDILLNMSIEYRAKLFWVFEGAAFIDAGNTWTIRNYVTQPGGVFRFDKFYKQIAAAYGVGLRMDFTYFLLRLDLGIKAHNPAMNQVHWPLIHPNLRRDATLHFAVGYPF